MRSKYSRFPVGSRLSNSIIAPILPVIFSVIPKDKRNLAA